MVYGVVEGAIIGAIVALVAFVVLHPQRLTFAERVLFLAFVTITYFTIHLLSALSRGTLT